MPSHVPPFYLFRTHLPNKKRRNPAKQLSYKPRIRQITERKEGIDDIELNVTNPAYKVTQHIEKMFVYCILSKPGKTMDEFRTVMVAKDCKVTLISQLGTRVGPNISSLYKIK